MTKWILSAALAVLFFLLAACGTSPPTLEETPVQEEDEGLATVAPPTTIRPEPSPTTAEAYPPQPTPAPAAEDEYPAPAAPPTAYPADMRIWVLRPLGLQCEESEENQFASVDEAVASLSDAGIEVFESETVGLMVCEACGCPTSEHYRVQILRSDLLNAQMLGWSQES